MLLNLRSAVWLFRVYSCFVLIESDACEVCDILLDMESCPSTSKKRLTGFNDKWITDPDFKEWIEKKNELTAICKVCNSDIAIQYEGRRSLVVSNFLYQNRNVYTCF